MRTFLRDFRLVDADTDRIGSVLVDGGIIAAILPPDTEIGLEAGDRVIDGRSAVGGQTSTRLALLPAFVELHAHFRDPGYPDKETLESASLAAIAGGYGTIVCMANTKPAMDNLAAARQLKDRSDRLGLIDLYPALSLTRGMEGKDSSQLDALAPGSGRLLTAAVKVVSEDGKDIDDDQVFITGLGRAAKAGLLVSCHCDRGGEETAVRRALDLAAAAGSPVHIAHVSVRDAVEAVRTAKLAAATGRRPPVSAEATPHHLALTVADAAALGLTGSGRVNPPLATETDRQAVIAGLLDGTIDAIATDHAPHTAADKAAGAPGFIGLETAFAVCYTELVATGQLSLSALSALMSQRPARLLSLADRGRITVGQHADFAIIDLDTAWTPEPNGFRSKSHNSPFIGHRLKGRIKATMHGGSIVFDGVI